MEVTKKIHDGFTCVLSFMGLSISLENINDILSIVLLTASITNILIMVVFRLYNILKDGKIDGDEIKELRDDVSNSIKEVEGDINEIDKNNRR